MNLKIFLCLILLWTSLLNAQVAFGTLTPDGVGNITVTWTNGGSPAVTNFFIYVGNGPAKYNYVNSGALAGTLLSFTSTNGALPVVIPPIPPATPPTIYVRLWFRFAGNTFWSYLDTTVFANATGTPPPPPADPELDAPLAGSTLCGSSATFEWDDLVPVPPVNLYWLYVGSGPGKYNYFRSASLPGTTTSLNVTGLPTTGVTLYVRLWYKRTNTNNPNTNNVWFFKNYVLFASSPGGGPTR